MVILIPEVLLTETGMTGFKNIPCTHGYENTAWSFNTVLCIFTENKNRQTFPCFIFLNRRPFI
ncbi:MAG: hypothetical protein B1H11_13175 [Desulfobacteraceae bacterium 4484_190.1]|nr:MAG: hypothetical protein B1H11_13175 [Desulfobacteraceae bacterium 4484_190.1]